MNILLSAIAACGLALFFTQVIADSGIIIQTNPSKTGGVIESFDAGSKFHYNVRASHTQREGARLDIGDRVDFTPGPGRIARNIRSEIIAPNQPTILLFDPEPDFSLVVLTNSVTFFDGSKRGSLAVSYVIIGCKPSLDDLCDAVEITIFTEPTDVEFDPPAPVTFPNIERLPPGKMIELFSFDHDTGEWRIIGQGTVSDDGLVITSDPGVGIVKPG